MRHVMPGRATFVGCSFRDVKIHDFFCLKAQFVDCVFTGRLKKVVFDARPRSGAERLGRDRNEYRGNDFSGAQLVNVSFRGGIDLDQQRLQDGPEYLVIRDARAVLKSALEEVRAWPEDEEQSRTLTKLEVMASTAARGQRDLFVARAFLGRTPESADRLAAILIRFGGHARAGGGGS